MIYRPCRYVYALIPCLHEPGMGADHSVTSRDYLCKASERISIALFLEIITLDLRTSAMKVFYDLDCLLHDPPHEILSGKLVPYLESPDRVRRIKDALTKSGSFELHLPEQSWPHDILHYVRMVHSEDYVNHIKNIYDEWVAEGGDEVGSSPRAKPYLTLTCSTPERRVP